VDLEQQQEFFAKQAEADAKERRRITEALSKPFPQEAIQYRVGGGGKQLAYVSGVTVRRRLDDVLNNNYDFITDPQIQWREWGQSKSGDDQWLAIVHGSMTIPLLGTRDGYGVQITTIKSEDLVKGAKTDCLKNCAQEFGVGRELYGEDLEAKAAEAAKPSPKKRLGELLKANGINNAAAADKAATERFNKTFKELTPDDTAAWLKELEVSEPIPY
jgi:hypothetical protein